MPTGPLEVTVGWAMSTRLSADEIHRHADEVAARLFCGWGKPVRVGEVAVDRFTRRARR